MAIEFAPASPGDLDAIASLLTGAFDSPPDAPFVSRSLLRWKYFEQWDPAGVARSYVLKQDGAVVAHCVAWPLRVRVAANGREARWVEAVCFNDWAGSRRLPGAGAILMKKLLARVPLAVVAGGTDVTRQTIPRLGFTICGTNHVYARSVRPLRQARTRPITSAVKDAARLARNAWRSRRPLGAVDAGWEARRVELFQRTVEHDASDTAAEHSAAYLNYWLKCPAAQVTGFELHEHGQLAGDFLLSRVSGQTRIAVTGLRSATRAHWEQAFRLAAIEAARDPETCEVVCAVSTPVAGAALAACGFERCDSSPLFVCDPHGATHEGAPLLWSAIDDDTAYLFDPAHPYKT